MWAASFAYVVSLSSFVNAETVRFAIDLSWGIAAPDGFEHPVILINGTSPGPALVINQGDDVEFLVRNGLDTKTAIHFHGIEQHHTPWSDGVPGLSQKPIAIDGEWIYKWTATQYGTHWYHSHYQAQTTDGLAGPIYVRPRDGESTPFDFITTDEDWLHVVAKTLYKAERESNIDIYCVQSILFNGKGAVNCILEEQQRAAIAPEYLALFDGGGPLHGDWLSPNGCLPFTNYTQAYYTFQPQSVPPEIANCEPTRALLEQFVVDPAARWASFHIIATMSAVAPIVSIDEHDMWVYAIDGRYVEPQKVQGFQFRSGERVSVLVRLDRNPGRYRMRANNHAVSQLIGGHATMTYIDSAYDDNSEAPYDHAVGPGAARESLDWYNTRDKTSSYIKTEHSKQVKVTARQRRTGHQVIRQHGDETESQPYFTYGGHPTSADVQLLNISDLIGFPNIPPAKEVQQTHVFYMSRSHSPWTWTVDGNASCPSLTKAYAEDHPLLYYPNSLAANNSDLVVRTLNDTWVDLVFVVTESRAPPHPMHKHSNKAYVIGKGVGEWKWNNVTEAAAAQPHNFNFETPLLTDSFTTLGATGQPTWLVVRYHSANPGAWMLHCHIQLHLSGGMAVALLDGMDVVPPVPEEYGVSGNGLGQGGPLSD